MERPFVYINMAMTVDGKITSAGREHPRLTTRHDRARMDRLRAEADAIVVGARTVRSDDPNLHVRGQKARAYRRSLGKHAGLLKIIVTAGCGLDPEGRFFSDSDGGGLIVATVEEAPAERLRAFEGRAEVWLLGKQRVDLKLLLNRLADRGVERLLVEGGGELNWELLRDDLVDELYVTIAPRLLGGRDAPTLLEGSGLSMGDQRRLRLLELDRQGDELYCRYAVER